MEYRSVFVPDSDLGTVDAQLNALGRDRWECYHVSDDRGGKTFFLKRRTSTTLANTTNLLRLAGIMF